MHDRIERMNEDTPGAALAAALRALPAAEPPRDGWQRLAPRLRSRRRRRTAMRIALPAALAAGIALTLWLPRLHDAAPPTSQITQPTASATVDTRLAALRARAQRLQAWVRTLDREGAPLDGDALATAVALQNRIGLIDLQLSAARDPGSRAALWQQRIELLQRLGLLHLEMYGVAEHLRATPNETTIL